MLMTIATLCLIGFIGLVFTTAFGLFESRKVSKLILESKDFGVDFSSEINKSFVFFKWLVSSDLESIESHSTRKRVARLKKLLWAQCLIFISVVLCQIILISNK
ncbi:hypothetical protein ACJJIG_01410 [Microbulbifer sp. SSSA007]|uniref:hypothetical protein n=1 Tax=unclassified Microbulbifer TaxID=2619833 RepID=UPI0040397BAC